MAQTEVIGGIVYEIGMDVSGLAAGQNRIRSAFNEIEGGANNGVRSMDRLDRQMNTTGQAMSRLSGVAASLAAALSVNQVASYSDAWTTLTNKLSNSIRETETLAMVTERVFNITQSTRSSLDATATLYARLERGTREYNTSAEDLVRLTTIINQGFVVSGATAQEAENAIIQLSQGIASGVLRGEEFNSVTEQGSRLAIALADSLGVGIGELRKMAGEGKLTTDVVVNGLLSQGSAIGKEFANTTMTISQALQEAGNNITKFFGESSTVASFTAIFNKSVISVSENIEALSTAITIVAGVVGGRYAAAFVMASVAKAKYILDSTAQSKASAASALSAEMEAKSKLRVAEADKANAISDLDSAQRKLNLIKFTNGQSVAEVRLAEAQAAQTRVQLAQIESEKILETQRFRSAATDQARAASTSRLATVQQSILVLNQRIAASEAATAQARAAAITAAEAQISAARIAAANTTGAATAANAAYTASQQATVVATRNASTAIGLFRAGLSLIGGGTGFAILAGAAIYYFWQQAKQAREEALAFADSLDRLKESMVSMNNTQLRGTIADTTTALEGQNDSADILRKEIAGLTAEYNDLTERGKVYGTTAEQGNGLLQRAAKLANELAKKKRDLANVEDKINKTTNTQSEASRILTNNMLSAMGVTEQLESKTTSLEKAQSAVAFAFGKTADEINRANQAGQSYDPKSLNIAPPTQDADKAILNLEEENELLKIKDERTRALRRSELESQKKTNNKNQLNRIAELTAENFDLQKAEDEAGKARKKSTPEIDKAADSLAKQKAQLDRLNTGYAEGSLELAKYDARIQLGDKASKEAIITSDRQTEALWKQQAAAKAADDAQKKKAQTESNYTALKSQTSPVFAVDNQFTQQMAQLNEYALLYPQKIAEIEATRATIEAQYRQQRQEAMWEEWSQQNAATQAAAAAFDSFGQTAGNALTGILTGSMSVSDALRSIGSNMVSSVINSFVQMGIEWAKAAIIGQAGMTAATASTVGQAAVIASSAAPAAALMSLATAGANAVPAQVGIGATVGLAKSLAVTGALYNGGQAMAGGLYEVGEKNKPEIFQASNGSQYMIPGDNGRVISNKDLGGTGGGVVVYNNITNNSSANVTSTATDNGDGSVTIDTIVADIEQNGPIGQSIGRNYNASRRANE